LVVTGENGAYTFEIKANSNSKVVTGSTTFTVYMAQELATIDFGNGTIQDTNESGTKVNSYTVSLDADEVTYFDLTDITATYNSTTTVKNSELTIVVKDADGNVVSDAATALKTPGTYYVTASVNGKVNKGTDYVAGSKTTKVVVEYAAPDASTTYMTYQGKNVDDELNVVYTGKDFVPDFAFKATSPNGNITYTQGTDYDLVITTTVNGKTAEVTEIVDAGEYTVTVKGKTFNGDVKFTVNVEPLSAVAASPVYVYYNDDQYGWTGDVIEASYKLFNKDGKEVTIPAEAYTVTYYKLNKDTGQYETTSTELKDAGTYKAVLRTADDVENYSVKAETTVVVSKDKVFLDVANTAWYAEYVYAANQQGYVNGYNNGNFFGPEDSIKRGDVALIIARMAGVASNGSEDQNSANYTYNNEFSDVDGGDYYARAIGWAQKMGIITGYGDGTFKPEQNVTREEFATMLARYAAKCGDDTAVETATELGKYTDGAAVCDWAKDAVAWASTKSIMNGYAGTTVLGPDNNVTRAEVAKMIVTYQPKASKVLGDNKAE
jgi:hypothetical protein